MSDNKNNDITAQLNYIKFRDCPYRDKFNCRTKLGDKISRLILITTCPNMNCLNPPPDTAGGPARQDFPQEDPPVSPPLAHP